jgi:hypothetical protein
MSALILTPEVIATDRVPGSQNRWPPMDRLRNARGSRDRGACRRHRVVELQHIVRIDKMRAYNLVNLQRGYGLLSIVSPLEVRFDEDS